MDIPEPSETPAPEVSLDMYKQHFETPFLAATEAYYVAESARYLAEHPFTAYLTRVCFFSRVSRRQAVRLTRHM